MRATLLKGKITPSRQLVVDIPAEIAPGVVEVILLYNPPAKAAKASRKKTTHPGFGLWAKRIDLLDSGDYAVQLRRQIERRIGRRV